MLLSMTDFRIDPNWLTTSDLLKMLTEEGSSKVGKLTLPEYWLYFSPPWTPKQRSLFIESKGIRMPTPVFYFLEYVSGEVRIIDGLQRFLTLRDFVGLEFALESTEYDLNSEGKKFDELEGYFQRRILETQYQVYKTDPSMPSTLVANVVNRLSGHDTSSGLKGRRYYLGIEPLSKYDFEVFSKEVQYKVSSVSPPREE